MPQGLASNREVRMKYLTQILMAMMLIFGLGSIASAQCDPATQSHIRCGYYNEGFQDGVRDAQERQANNYQRYRSKYERQYENFYRDGYRAGYTSVPTFGRWTSQQRLAYDRGYNLGANDRRTGRAESSRQSEIQAAMNVRPYHAQGYMDGYSGTPRRYDFQIGTNPGFPGPGFPGPGFPGPGTGGTTGSVVWNGRVDDRVRVFVQGNRIWGQDMTNTGFQQGAIAWNGSLPRRATNVSVNKRDGRGTAFVVEQPNSRNAYTATIEISDPRSGDDNYRLEITWQGSSVTSPVYSSGRVSWRGRVDERVNIMISGQDVWDETLAGIPTSNITFDIQGYLASSSGTLRANKRNGRGSVQVIQQPSFANGFVGIVQVHDPSGGADQYDVEITW